jgi:hypothetical protein
MTHRNEFPAKYSLAGCSPVSGCYGSQNSQGTVRENRAPRLTVIRPSYALVLNRARFSSVVPGCVVKTVVTPDCRKDKLCDPV